MEPYDMQKIAKTGGYEITVNQNANCMVMTFFGIWDETSELEYYRDDVNRALTKLERGFNLIIDLRQYRGSVSEFVHLHIEALEEALKAGLKRTAVVMFENPMLKVTVEYVFKESGTHSTFFSNMSLAENWVMIK